MPFKRLNPLHMAGNISLVGNHRLDVNIVAMLQLRVIGVVLVCLLCSWTDGANILVLQTAAAASHSLWIDQICQLLAKRHQITVLDATSQVTLDVPNVTRIRLEDTYKYQFNQFTELEYASVRDSMTQLTYILFKLSEDSCIGQLWSPTMVKFVRELNSSVRFDLIMHDATNCESFLGVVEVLGRPPLVRLMSMDLPYALEPAGSYENPAYVVNFLQAHYSHPMSFLQRVENTLYALYSRWAYAAYLKVQEDEARRFFGSGLPPLRQILADSRLTLFNSHFMINPARPLPPNVIDIAGFHIRPAKPLEQKLKSFIESAEHGVIYLSLGTKLLSSTMTKDKKEMFINTLQSLRQKVLWKWECDNSTGMPPNVFTSKWFPQADILAHPNVKLFITHAGLFGTQEAIYHGVPMVAMPFYIDQHPNAMKIDKLGYGVKLAYPTLTAEKLKNAIETVINDQSFSNRIKHASRLFKDQPMDIRDKVMYWIEYVLRHKNLQHLRPPTADMSLYQILLVDVIAFLLAMSCFILIVMYYVSKSTYHFCKRKILQPVAIEKKNK